MNQRISTIKARRQRRLRTLAWMTAVAIAIIILLYKEQVELLYLLATISVTVLLIVVARANLGDAGRANMEAKNRQNIPKN